MLAKRLGHLIVIFLLAVIIQAPSASATILSIDELEALAALRYGSATSAQKALLFSRNDAVNRAAIQGYITDDLYQHAQREFAGTNQRLARDAALEAGAEFRVQTASSATYSPGTDSDYITKITDPDQVVQMQDGYNRRINAYLKKNGLSTNRTDWHVQLDTDFMADPGGVTDAQFRTIAKLNNDAYRRRTAALYEAVSRAPDGTRVPPELFTGYAEEMKEFIAKKQKLLARMRQNPQMLQQPSFQAEFHRLMAQEQKYISRIEGSNVLLRGQRGLAPIQSLDDVALYTVRKADDGTWHLLRDPSIAKLGSKRAAALFRTTATANAVARNSLENAIERLAQSMAEASLRDPDFARAAARDIATLLSDFPPARRGSFIDAIARSQGDDVARDIVEAMRAQQRAALLAGKSGLRRWAGRMLNALRVAGVAYDLYAAGSAMHEYVTALQGALDPDVTDADAEALFAKAEAAGARMALAGGLGALFEAYPTVALAMGEFALVNYGTRWVLENTETGKRFDLAVADLFDRHWQAAERFSCDVREFFGFESECERLRAIDQKLLAAVLGGIREGRWQLADGMTMLDVINAIRAGKYNEIDQIVVHADAWKAAIATIKTLERRLAELKARCLPGGGSAGAAATSRSPAAPTSATAHRAVLQACHSAREALAGVQLARRDVDSSTQRALEQFGTAERGIKQCAGLAQLDQAFATAQSASSNAAQAARGFVDLLEKVDVAGTRVDAAKLTSAQAAAAMAQAQNDCTKDINDLINAAAVAQADIPWQRLVKRVRSISDGALGVVKSRSEDALASDRAALADCSKLADPFMDQLLAMQTVLKLVTVPEKRRAIERAAQACRDRIDAEAAPAAPVATTGAAGAAEAAAGRADPEALQNCYCACKQGRTNFSCSYNTEDKGWSPSCRDLSNGPCICKAFGCFRAQPVTTGDCAAECRAKFGG